MPSTRRPDCHFGRHPPPNGPCMATVLALHGFTRRPRHLAAFSEACQRRGWNCLRPALAPSWLPMLMNSCRHLDHVTKRVIDSGRIMGPVVVVGHSAGAAAGTWMTTRLVMSGVEVRGLVYVDGNDSPNHLIERAWPELADIPIRAVMAPPGPCNRDGQLTRFLEAQRPGSVAIIPGAGHGDIEMQGATVYRRVCKDTSELPEWLEVQSTVLASIGQLLEES